MSQRLPCSRFLTVRPGQLPGATPGAGISAHSAPRRPSARSTPALLALAPHPASRPPALHTPGRLAPLLQQCVSNLPRNSPPRWVFLPGVISFASGPQRPGACNPGAPSEVLRLQGTVCFLPASACFLQAPGPASGAVFFLLQSPAPPHTWSAFCFCGGERGPHGARARGSGSAGEVPAGFLGETGLLWLRGEWKRREGQEFAPTRSGQIS